MGGKNPAIVTAHADLDKAAEGVARAAFGLAGQKCSACSRAIVARDVHDEFVSRLAAWARAPARSAIPPTAASFVGPVVNAASVARFEAAVADGAPRRAASPPAASAPTRPGQFVEPTVVCDLPRRPRSSATSCSCPSSPSRASASLDEALAEANAPAYGLTAGIFSEDQAEIDRFLDEIQAGVVYVNRRAGATTGAWPGTQTFCGWKSSGSTGKGGLGPYYLPQFMREQSRTVVRGGHPVVSLYQVAPAAVAKGPQMAATTTLESNSAAQRRLAKELLSLDRSIDREQVGPKRLELLREQASVSDKLEALRSTRV